MKKELSTKNNNLENTNKDNVNYNNILDFFYEVGMLKREPRAGWLRAHIKNPESVADHTARSTFIAYVLAKLEGANSKDAALICAFHELGEARIGDLDKVHSRYFSSKKDAEKTAVDEQLLLLPKEIADEIGFFILNEGTDNSKEQIIAKDADYLECAIQAKEYLEQGYSHAENWLINCGKCIKTDSAKKIYDLIKDSNSQNWYQSIKKIQRLN